MSYKVEIRSDKRAYPIIVCDQCVGAITDAGESSALWLETGAASVGRHDVKHVHDRCFEAFEAAHPAGPGGHWMNNEIDHHLFMLMLGSGYDEKVARRKALTLSMIA